MLNRQKEIYRRVEKGAWEELKKYLSGMTEQIKHLTSPYETGNRIPDIVTNYLLSGENLNADIRIYRGVRIADEIPQQDLCTIYGNLSIWHGMIFSGDKKREAGRRGVCILNTEITLCIGSPDMS